MRGRGRGKAHEDEGSATGSLAADGAAVGAHDRARDVGADAVEVPRARAGGDLDGDGGAVAEDADADAATARRGADGVQDQAFEGLRQARRVGARGRGSREVEVEPHVRGLGRRRVRGRRGAHEVGDVDRRDIEGEVAPLEAREFAEVADEPLDLGDVPAHDREGAAGLRGRKAPLEKMDLETDRGQGVAEFAGDDLGHAYEEDHGASRDDAPCIKRRPPPPDGCTTGEHRTSDAEAGFLPEACGRRTAPMHDPGPPRAAAGNAPKDASDRIRWLLALGLTEHQARTYVAALERPGAPAGLLARTARVPRNRVYDALDDLHAEGLIDISLGPRRAHFPRPLTTLVDRRVAHLRRAIAELEDRRDALDAAFRVSAVPRADATTGRTRALLGRAAVAREIDRMVEGAADRVVAVSTPGGAPRLVRHLHAALARGLDVRILVPERAASGLDPDLAARGVLRPIATEIPALSVVVDSSEALVSNPVPDDGALRFGKDQGVLTDDPAFVEERLAFARALEALR